MADITLPDQTLAAMNKALFENFNTVSPNNRVWLLGHLIAPVGNNRISMDPTPPPNPKDTEHE